MTDKQLPKIALMGNPNIGKSVVFSRLTGARVIAANYPGSTVDFSEGRIKLGDDHGLILDAPGTYTLHPTNKAEEVAVQMCDECDVIVNVVDATNLERNLFLTLELLEKGKPMVVVLNMWDETKHLGIDIDTKKLEEVLGVPVIATVGLTGEGIKHLAKHIGELIKKPGTEPTPTADNHAADREKWARIGEIVTEVQTLEHRHHTFRQILGEVTIRPITGLPIAVLVLVVAFWLVRMVGEGLIGYVMDPLFELYTPFAMWVGEQVGDGFWRDILIGHLIDGKIDYVQSLGVITTALYVPFAMVLPYIIAFYFALSLMEDSGYLPRLATLMDNVFHKLGIHGHGIVPVCLGLGCNVTGMLSARTLETRKQRFICCVLIGISVPCMAQSAMIFGVLAHHGLAYLLIVVAALFCVFVVSGVVMSRVVAGDSPEIFLEIPPYRRPSIRATVKKTWMRVRWFLLDAIPWLFLGVLAINLLFAAGVLDLMAKIMAPVVEHWLGLPPEAATALLAGFLRKDLAVGMLLPLSESAGMTPGQLVIAVTVLTVYFPCAATFAVMFKELGLRDMLKATSVMIGVSLLIGGILRLILVPF